MPSDQHLNEDINAELDFEIYKKLLFSLDYYQRWVNSPRPKFRNSDRGGGEGSGFPLHQYPLFWLLRLDSPKPWILSENMRNMDIESVEEL